MPTYVEHRLDSHDRGTIHVVEQGNEFDPPVVLSHGVTLSVRTWFHQLEDLPKEGLRAIAFDHRGHGRSVLGEEGHSLENLGRDFRTVLEDLDLHDAVLVGHSMGGVAVQSFVTRFPEIAAQRVAGIVLLSTLAYTPLGSRSTRTKAQLEKVLKRAPDSQWLWDSPNLGFVAARVGFGKDPKPSHIELVRQMMGECPPETRVDAPRVLVGLDLRRQLPDIDIPTLVIGGTADVLTPPFEAKQMARLIPGARLELIRGGGHMLMLERTDEIDRLIAGFARRGPGPPDLTRSGRASMSNVSRLGISPERGFGIDGVRIGHVTGSGTGVTVLCFPAGSVGSAEVRGGAPATRETDLLDPSRTVARVDAIVLAGGSAFGLAAADGVMRYLAERGQGFATAGGPVPIVPAACIFDLAEATVLPPGAADGYRAAEVAGRNEGAATGRVGAGAGATVGKWRGREGAVAGGVGIAVAAVDGVRVGALAVVNALGDVVAGDATTLAGSTAPAEAVGFPTPQPFEEERTNTTLVVVVTDAKLDKLACYSMAQSAHDGFAQALRPAHTALRRRHRVRSRDRFRAPGDGRGTEPRPASARCERRRRGGHPRLGDRPLTCAPRPRECRDLRSALRPARRVAAPRSRGRGHVGGGRERRLGVHPLPARGRTDAGGLRCRVAGRGSDVRRRGARRERRPPR